MYFPMELEFSNVILSEADLWGFIKRNWGGGGSLGSLEVQRRGYTVIISIRVGYRDTDV